MSRIIFIWYLSYGVIGWTFINKYLFQLITHLWSKKVTKKEILQITSLWRWPTVIFLLHKFSCRFLFFFPVTLCKFVLCSLVIDLGKDIQMSCWMKQCTLSYFSLKNCLKECVCMLSSTFYSVINYFLQKSSWPVF